MNYKTFNSPDLLNHFEGNEEILVEMIVMFQNAHPELLRSIREAITKELGSDLKISAHTFKGIMRNFYADDCIKLAYDLEKAGEALIFSGQLDKFKLLEEKSIQLSLELTQLKNELEKLT